MSQPRNNLTLELPPKEECSQEICINTRNSHALDLLPQSCKENKDNLENHTMGGERESTECFSDSQTLYSTTKNSMSSKTLSGDSTSTEFQHSKFKSGHGICCNAYSSASPKIDPIPQFRYGTSEETQSDENMFGELSRDASVKHLALAASIHCGEFDQLNACTYGRSDGPRSSNIKLNRLRVDRIR